MKSGLKATQDFIASRLDGIAASLASHHAELESHQSSIRDACQAVKDEQQNARQALTGLAADIQQLKGRQENFSVEISNKFEEYEQRQQVLLASFMSEIQVLVTEQRDSTPVDGNNDLLRDVLSRQEQLLRMFSCSSDEDGHRRRTRSHKRNRGGAEENEGVPPVLKTVVDALRVVIKDEVLGGMEDTQVGKTRAGKSAIGARRKRLRLS